MRNSRVRFLLEQACQLLVGAIQTGAITRTFLALHTLHARLRTLPSACTTSAANSIPNLVTISIDEDDGLLFLERSHLM